MTLDKHLRTDSRTAVSPEEGNSICGTSDRMPGAAAQRKRLGLGVLSPALLWVASVAIGGTLGFIGSPDAGPPQDRSFTVRIRQYAYDPPVLHVNRGDTVHLRFISEDVVHGFYLEGHDIDVAVCPLRPTVQYRRPSRPGISEDVEEIKFVAEHEGKYRYRCSQTCGFLHPFTLGEMVVGPNHLLLTSIGLAVGWLLGGFLYVSMRESA